MELLRKNWWVLALQGLLFIALGALVIFSSGFRLTDLISYLGIILLVFGLLMVIWGWRHRSTQSSWWGLAFIGLLQIIVGVLILADSSRATSVFSYTIGGWATLMGIAQFIMGFGKKSNRLLYFLNGAVSIVMGVLIIYNPFQSANAMTYLVGFYSLLLGLFIVYYSIKARNFANKNQQSKKSTPLENEEASSTNSEDNADKENTL
jgi:uncharacterized membrane protein HdeD (DUF308 family)